MGTHLLYKQMWLLSILTQKNFWRAEIENPESLQNASQEYHGTMSNYYTIRIKNRQTGTFHTVRVPEDEYILHSLEAQGVKLPFSCRNGACTTCAVRVLSGEVYQPEAMGLSPELRQQGYALLCVSYARSDMFVETQDEDEVYELQFGRYFAKGRVRFGLPLDED